MKKFFFATVVAVSLVAIPRSAAAIPGGREEAPATLEEILQTKCSPEKTMGDSSLRRLCMFLVWAEVLRIDGESLLPKKTGGERELLLRKLEEVREIQRDVLFRLRTGK